MQALACNPCKAPASACPLRLPLGLPEVLGGGPGPPWSWSLASPLFCPRPFALVPLAWPHLPVQARHVARHQQLVHHVQHQLLHANARCVAARGGAGGQRAMQPCGRAAVPPHQHALLCCRVRAAAWTCNQAHCRYRPCAIVQSCGGLPYLTQCAALPLSPPPSLLQAWLRTTAAMWTTRAAPRSSCGRRPPRRGRRRRPAAGSRRSWPPAASSCCSRAASSIGRCRQSTAPAWWTGGASSLRGPAHRPHAVAEGGAGPVASSNRMR